MSLIKCCECKKEISDKASACPHCGCPLELEKKESNLIKVERLKEIPTKKTILLHFLLSFILFLLICLPLKYGSNYQKSYSIISLFLKGLANDLIKLLPFGLIIFINFFISILTRKNSKAPKIIYLISLIFLVFINYQVTKEGIQLHYVYPLMYLTTASLIFLKRDIIIKKEEVNVSKEKKKEIEELNKKLEESHKKEDNKLLKIIILIFVILLGIISSLIFMSKNNKENIPLDEIINISQVASGNVMYVRITNEFINIRSNPDTSSDKIGTVLKDEEYEVIEVKVGNVYKWYKIKDKNNLEGYIANPKYGDKYIKLLEISENDSLNKEKYTFHDTVDKNDSINTNDEGVEINPNENNNNNNIVSSSSSSSNNNNNTNNSQNKKPSTSSKTSGSTSNSNSTSSNTTAKPETNNNNNNTNNNQEKEENNNTTTESDKKNEECNNQILERTEQYEKDYEKLDNYYIKQENSIKNSLENVSNELDTYGGYISQSSYNSQKSSLQSQYNSAYTAYQRASLDTSGASASLILKYQKQIEEIREEMSYLAIRYELSQDYDILYNDYYDLLNEHKNELQELYNKFSKDIDAIETNC